MCLNSDLSKKEHLELPLGNAMLLVEPTVIASAFVQLPESNARSSASHTKRHESGKAGSKAISSVSIATMMNRYMLNDMSCWTPIADRQSVCCPMDAYIAKSVIASCRTPRIMRCGKRDASPIPISAAYAQKAKSMRRKQNENQNDWHHPQA